MIIALSYLSTYSLGSVFSWLKFHLTLPNDGGFRESSFFYAKPWTGFDELEVDFEENNSMGSVPIYMCDLYLSIFVKTRVPSSYICGYF